MTYFVTDGRKAGGAYVTVTGNVKRMDGYKRIMTLMGETNIPLGDVLELESHLFSELA